ncbi:hypothetical protein HMPREF3067_08030 [Corynebacterium sp. HMSC04H06]|nr:hypothetical protein HMPREF3067_08030 [Corynebacterium sp. HMSC04H06]
MGQSVEDRVAALRAQMEKMGGGSALPARGPKQHVARSAESGAEQGNGKSSGDSGGQAALAGALPAGGLVRGSAVRCSECPAFIIELVCQATEEGYYVALVGWPELALAQVCERGDISKVVAVPDPGTDPWAVSATLVEGMDFVIQRVRAASQQRVLSPARARPVAARLRQGRAVLITVGQHVPSAALRLDAQVESYPGIGRGCGRIRGVEVRVQVYSKYLSHPAQSVVRCA